MMDAENAPNKRDHMPKSDSEEILDSAKAQEAIPEKAMEETAAVEETAIELSDSPIPISEETVEESGQEPDASEDLTVDESAQVIAQLQEGNRALHDKLLRSHADFENLRRRHVREKEDQIQAARKVIFRDLLDIMDNFERALDAAKDPDDPFVVGVSLIYRQFREFLNQNQILEIIAVDREFNPYLHEAIAQQKSPDHPENTVIEVFQKGYTYRGKLLRASQVKVAIKLDDEDVVSSDSDSVEQPTQEN